MRLPMLRETRMPAVLCVFGPVVTAIDADPAVATAMVTPLEPMGLTGLLSAVSAWADWSTVP